MKEGGPRERERQRQRETERERGRESERHSERVSAAGKKGGREARRKGGREEGMHGGRQEEGSEGGRERERERDFYMVECLKPPSNFCVQSEIVSRFGCSNYGDMWLQRNPTFLLSLLLDSCRFC